MTLYQIKINEVPFSEPIPQIDAYRIYAASVDCVKNIEMVPVEINTKSMLQELNGGKKTT